MARLRGKPLELTINLIKSMKDVPDASTSIEVASSLCDTIEAQQQEIEQLKQDREDYKESVNYMNRVSYALQTEIEQLKAQNNTMCQQVDIIRQRLHGLSYQSSHGEHPRIVEIEEIDDMLDELGFDAILTKSIFHNPADAATLEKLTDDFGALNSLYDAEHACFLDMVQEEKELFREIEQKDKALKLARGALVTVGEMSDCEVHDICSKDIEAIDKAIGGGEK